MKQFNKSKECKSTLIILSIVVGILSVVVYITATYNKTYSKTVDVNLEIFDYDKTKATDKEKYLNLDKIIPIDGQVTDLSILRDEVLIDLINGEKRSIEVLNYKSNKIDKTVYSNKFSTHVHGNLYVAPSKKLLIYGVRDKETQKIDYYLYNFIGDTVVSVGKNLKILQWIPDSSGFLAIQKEQNELIYYDVSTNQSKILAKLDINIYIQQVEFSQDGTKIYILFNDKKDKKNTSTLIFHDKKENLTKELKKLNVNNHSWINYFDIIDNENIIICETTNKHEYLNIYNITNKVEKNITSKHIHSTNLSENKQKLVSVETKDISESKVEFYSIINNTGDIDLIKLSEINNIEGSIDAIDISDSKILFSIYNNKINQSIVYIYDILSN